MTQSVPLDLLLAEPLAEHSVRVWNTMRKVNLLEALLKFIVELHLVQAIL